MADTEVGTRNSGQSDGDPPLVAEKLIAPRLGQWEEEWLDAVHAHW